LTHQYRPSKWQPTPDQRWERCGECGKRGYPDRRTARARRREQIRDFKEKISDLSVYKCDSGLFHLGHPPGHHYIKGERP
jgi:hypothetical protein